MRHDVEPGSPPSTVSQPVRRRFRVEPDHAVYSVPRSDAPQVVTSDNLHDKKKCADLTNSAERRRATTATATGQMCVKFYCYKT
jgi:hypothetical protein